MENENELFDQLRLQVSERKRTHRTAEMILMHPNTWKTLRLENLGRLSGLEIPPPGGPAGTFMGITILRTEDMDEGKFIIR